MSTHTSIATVCLSLLLATGCDKKGTDNTAPESAPLVKDGEATAQKKAFKDLLTAKAPTLPPPYAGLKFGMTKAEADKVHPGVVKAQRVVANDFDGRFSVYFDRTSERIKRFSLMVEKEQLPFLTEAWGPSKKGVDTIKRPQEYWFNPTSKVRAILEEGYGDAKHLNFTSYVPAAQWLGAGKELAFEAPQSILGANIEQLRAGYKNWLVETSQAAADKNRKDLEKFSGQKLNALGRARPSVHMDFPPTEWGAFFTRVNMMFDKQDQVSRYSFSLSFAPHPAAKPEIFKLFVAKWGEPVEAKKYGRTHFVFNAKAPKITVEEDTISHGWRVTIEK